MEERTKCKIKSHIPGDPVPTMSVTFDCGYLAKNETEGIGCEVLRGGYPRNHLALVSRRNQLYSGSPSPPSETYCNTLLLVVDGSGKGTILPTAPCRLTNCTSQVAPKKQKLDNTTALDLDISKFGSKKFQRSVNTTKKLRDTKAVTSSALEKSLMDIKETDLDVLDTSVGGQASGYDLVTVMLPPCNRDATDVANVYQVSGLLSQSDLADLEEAAEMYLNPPDDPSKDPYFLVNPFYVDMKNKTLLKMQLLLYANCILVFCRHAARVIRSRTETINLISPHSYSFGKRVLDMFTLPSGSHRTKSNDLTDKALCHAMVAVLLACDYKLQVEWFSGCLKTVTKKHVMDLMKVVGLQRASKLAPKYYILKLPLPPIITTRKPKKRKVS